MNQSTIKKLKDNALAIEKFRTLADSEQEWLLPLFAKSTILALKILDAIADNPLTFEEIAQICECSPQTVSQILNGLEQGGMTIQLDKLAAFAPKGRLRKLARR
ncbi:winged helix-turn-helix transcriptional regulator [Nostocales cyanobacterium LEGE 11386]|nr:winged helix-turn-helix transcriptional regulator [Nostocales cyanobacterium LEGE 11386]